MRREFRLWATPARHLLAAAIVVGWSATAAAPAQAQDAYIPGTTNAYTGMVSVITTTSNTVVGTTSLTFGSPTGVAVSPDGSKVYVASTSEIFGGSADVEAITTATNMVSVIVLCDGIGCSAGGVAVSPDGSTVYVTAAMSTGTGYTYSVVVLSTASNAVIGSPITVGSGPSGVAVTPDGSKVYVASSGGTVSVIATASNTVIATIPVSGGPEGVAVSPDGREVYITNFNGATVSVIATETNTVIATVPVGSRPDGVAVTPDSSEVFVTNSGDGTVSVIATASNTVIATIAVGGDPTGVAVTPDGGSVYVENTGSSNVSVIATASNTVIGSPIAVGASSGAIGDFMGPVLPILTITETGSGAGQVTSSPLGINCGAGSTQCAVGYPSGTSVTLSAVAASGSVFAGWSGGGCGGTGACTVTVSAAQSVSASFAATTATLTVSESGAGSGQVTSNPAGISCSASSNQCSASFAIGAPVTLTASASAGSAFTGWSGGGCIGTAPCILTLTAGTAVAATFVPLPSYMLSIVPSGTGTGTVTSNPSGIACGSTCNASFYSGQQITLAAAATNGSTFAGWSGGGCVGVDPCAVTLTANTTVTASFVQNSTTSIALQAAVLPLSRSIEVGATATAFATILNAGPGTASTCSIAPATSIPASFAFQTTDPTTNALTGTANTPADIAQGVGQSFVIAFTPADGFPPTNVILTFGCANASPAPAIVGIDTLNLSASLVPVPDIVALAASSDPGYIDIPGPTGTGDFAVATVNLGSASQITASANTGTANLPVILTICQTNSSSGACLAAPAANVTTTIAADATLTVGIFVAGSAAVPDLPGLNRVYVTFTDANGVLRGETSVAVRTQ